MTRKPTSVICDEEIWHEFKLICLKKRIQISDQLEGLIRKFIDENGD